MSSFIAHKTTTFEDKRDNVRHSLSTYQEGQKGKQHKENHSNGFDFTKIPLHSPNSVNIQPKLNINNSDDYSEREADRIAEQVVGMSATSMQRKSAINGQNEAVIQTKAQGNSNQTTSTSLSKAIEHNRGGGQPIDRTTLGFMESRFGMDFGKVRIHTGKRAAAMNQEVQARAFTTQKDIFFNEGEYRPTSLEGRRLLAHELTHVVQQEGNGALGIQRKVELRPPGRGEASAFDRANELINRLNDISLGVSYSLAGDGRTMEYFILIPNALSEFDFQMMDFIDLEQTIPMRLVNEEGRINGHPIIGDTFQFGYVDLDDLMASDDLAFQSILLHFLQERAVTRRYAQRIGTQSLNSNTPAGGRAFRRGHRAGHKAQSEHWQAVMGDSSIEFSTENITNGTANIVFRSKDHNYRIFITLRGVTFGNAGQAPRTTTGGLTRVRYKNQWFSVEEFLKKGIVSGSSNPFSQPFVGRPQNARFPNFGLPSLELNPSFQYPIRDLTMPLTPSTPAPFTIPNNNLFEHPNLLAPPPHPGPLQIRPSFLSSPSSLTSITDRMDWFSINLELRSRGVALDSRLGDSITSTWERSFNFFRQHGVSEEQSVLFTNMTISLAVGAGLSRDFPTAVEQLDRELNTSTINIPVSEIVRFLHKKIF